MAGVQTAQRDISQRGQQDAWLVASGETWPRFLCANKCRTEGG